jgi:hypothetical protein
MLGRGALRMDDDGRWSTAGVGGQDDRQDDRHDGDVTARSMSQFEPLNGGLPSLTDEALGAQQGKGQSASSKAGARFTQPPMHFGVNTRAVVKSSALPSARSASTASSSSSDPSLSSRVQSAQGGPGGQPGQGPAPHRHVVEVSDAHSLDIWHGGRAHAFEFDRVLPGECSTPDVLAQVFQTQLKMFAQATVNGFDLCWLIVLSSIQMHSLLEATLDGFSACLLTVGAQASGKTHTLVWNHSAFNAFLCDSLSVRIFICVTDG